MNHYTLYRRREKKAPAKTAHHQIFLSNNTWVTFAFIFILNATIWICGKWKIAAVDVAVCCGQWPFEEFPMWSFGLAISLLQSRSSTVVVHYARNHHSNMTGIFMICRICIRLWKSRKISSRICLNMCKMNELATHISFTARCLLTFANCFELSVFYDSFL